MAELAYSEYADRNGAPILEVLQKELADTATVLEIGSGTGQHAVRLASALSHLTWQCSDMDENLAAIRYRLQDAKLENLLAPLSLDVRSAKLSGDQYGAVFSANTAHIMSFQSVEKMFHIVDSVLLATGVFCLYGPFRQDGEFNTPSNEAFHHSLQARDPHMGIRDLEDLDALAATASMRRIRLYAMPANNQLAVWQKEA